ncbi:PmoA family protein [Paenibacillus sp. Soil750]|uniref:DUF6807 domain-containing protein n=1 Tax=Paenibacillus sp. Soil750 TaxID=1736398 RepID=UPI0006F918A6|nr:PmoA family protein [Paenibacillus sp. Soil750]KRE63336.1 hypothetical protein ASL11_23575 [Paenibacillus sp. Soil750]
MTIMKQQLESETLVVTSSDHYMFINRKGEERPFLTQQAELNRRPFIHPIVAPDGKGVLTEDAPAHHPWQHGLYVGLNDVNGYGFWTEGVSNAPTDGSFHPAPLMNISLSGNEVCWTVRSSWREPGGELLLIEEQNWCLKDLGSTYELDMSWTLKAEKDLSFGQYAYGGLFLRMPYRHEQGGVFLNSEGHTPQEADGERARWAAIHMPIEGRQGHAGMAIFDHAGNPEYPSPWRVDGELGISPSRCIAGSWRLNKGESHLAQYRIVIYHGTLDANEIEKKWLSYIGG